MSLLTESEILWQHVCSTLGIKYVKTDTTNQSKLPDYRLITPSGEELFSEVKEFANDKSEGDLGSHKIGTAVRNKIDKAKPQLKIAKQSGKPAVLVLYNQRKHDQSSDYDILTAMFGYETTTVLVPHDTSKRPFWSGKYFFGKNKRVTPNQNTTLSAIIKLQWTDKSTLKVFIYHNPYASHKLMKYICGFKRFTFHGNDVFNCELDEKRRYWKWSDRPLFPTLRDKLIRLRNRIRIKLFGHKRIIVNGNSYIWILPT